MSPQNMYLILAAVAGFALSMPFDIAVPNSLDLETILNKTVCPIKIQIDVDLNRIPKRIKMLKCARNPNQWCAEMHIPKHECCQHQHDDMKLECVEMQDTVQVYYPKQNVSQPLRVSVGCTCVIEKTQRVVDAEPAR